MGKAWPAPRDVSSRIPLVSLLPGQLSPCHHATIQHSQQSHSAWHWDGSRNIYSCSANRFGLVCKSTSARAPAHPHRLGERA